MLVINRLTLIVILVPLIVPVLNVLCSSQRALPGQPRRPQSFVDRLISTSPFRVLARYFGQKRPNDLYYPPAHSQVLQHQQTNALLYMPVTQPPTTHYTKITTMTPVYFHPTMAMMNPPSHTPVLPQTPTYMLHGISYPLQTQQQQINLQYAMPVYQNPAMTVLPQSNILLNNGHHQTSPSGQVESPQHHTTTSTSDKLPTIVGSAEEINEQPSNSGLLSLHNFPQISENAHMQVNGYEDASSSDDMLKIFVIRPKDLERMKSSSEEERKELVKEYSTKYIDVDQRAQELVLRSTDMEGDFPRNNNNCIEPLCDPFLRRLIPALMSPSNNKYEMRAKANDDPIVIIKNDSDSNNIFHGQDSHLKNHRLDNASSDEEHEIPEFTVVKAIEEDNRGTGEVLQGENSTLNPSRVRVHFPRRKFISAKLKSENSRKYEPQSSQTQEPNITLPHLRNSYSEIRRDHTSSTPSTLSDADPTILSRPIVNSETDIKSERSYPLYKYASRMRKQRMIRGSSGISQTENYKSPHYTAGVIFNI